ncbi:MAG TPA: UdgX family uracil-DNA binding protein [Acidimicrobiales bacterium]|nr:UdgX family uracil-DNA binding protein [Acidimicrobiales bacterium]
MGADQFLPPERRDLEALRRAGDGCQGCDLYEHATQTVFGAGNARAKVMLVGEQPGDREDIEGKPFVGPAGALLDQALAEAGLDRGSLYVTNAVKHFKWERRGKVRLHKKPGAREVAACKPWLLAEIDAVQPEIVVCLGATAAQALLGAEFRVTRQRGQIMDGPRDTPTMATVHPSSILRTTDQSERQSQLAQFVEDLRVAVGFRAGRGTTS